MLSKFSAQDLEVVEKTDITDSVDGSGAYYLLDDSDKSEQSIDHSGSKNKISELSAQDSEVVEKTDITDSVEGSCGYYLSDDFDELQQSIAHFGSENKISDIERSDSMIVMTSDSRQVSQIDKEDPLMEEFLMEEFLREIFKKLDLESEESEAYCTEKEPLEKLDSEYKDSEYEDLEHEDSEHEDSEHEASDACCSEEEPLSNEAQRTKDGTDGACFSRSKGSASPSCELIQDFSNQLTNLVHVIFLNEKRIRKGSSYKEFFTLFQKIIIFEAQRSASKLAKNMSDHFITSDLIIELKKRIDSAYQNRHKDVYKETCERKWTSSKKRQDNDEKLKLLEDISVYNDSNNEEYLEEAEEEKSFVELYAEAKKIYNFVQEEIWPIPLEKSKRNSACVLEKLITELENIYEEQINNDPLPRLESWANAPIFAPKYSSKKFFGPAFDPADDETHSLLSKSSSSSEDESLCIHDPSYALNFTTSSKAMPAKLGNDSVLTTKL